MTSTSDSSPKEKSVWLHSLVAVLLLSAAVVVTYWPVVSCGFVLRDDDQTLFDNPYLKPPSVHGLIRYWTWPAMRLYMPVTYTVWSGLALLTAPPLPGETFELDPLPFHVTNLVVHLVSAIFAWLILRRCFGSIWAAMIGAMLFAVHPVQVESVAWASGLKDVMAGCFSLVAVWEYLLFSDTPMGAPARRWRYGLIIVWLYVAQLSKPSAVVVPIVIFAIDWLILQRPIKVVAGRVWPILVCCLPVMVVASAIQHPPSEADLLHRPLVAMNTVSFYAWKIVWPAGLAPDYALTATRVLASAWIKWCWVIPAAGLILLGATRNKTLIAGAMIFIGGILPVLGLVTFGFEAQSTVADHYLYLSMFGLALVMAWILVEVQAAWVWAVAIAVVAALAVRSNRQVMHWRDTIALFTNNAEVVPWSWVAQTQIGFELENEGKASEAGPHFRAALAISELPVTLMNLGACLAKQGRTQEAIDPLEKAVQLDANNEQARLSLASCYAQLNRRGEAIEQLKEVLKKNPDNAAAKKLLEAIENQ